MEGYVLHCQDGTSDKLYVSYVKSDSNNRGDKEYVVMTKWGRRTASSLIMKPHSVYRTKEDAIRAMHKLAAEKTAKGYVEVGSAAYQGPVTRKEIEAREMADAMDAPVRPLSDDLRRTVRFPEKQQPFVPQKSKIQELLVICLNNIGVEEHFDMGVEYLALGNSNPNFLTVEDKFGKTGDYDKARFEIVKG
jgi:predicted DNA-binding WGR domain protein